MNRRQLLMLAGLAPLAAAAAPVASYVQRRAHPRRIRPATGFHADYFPNVVLRTQDDRPVRLYDDLLRGKNVLVNFFYANCKDGICPVTTQNLVRVQRLLGERCGRDVFMYSFSLAPEQDTPARLRHYAAMHGTGPGWLFLTGAVDDLELCRVRLGFTDPDPKLDRQRGQHTAVVLLGNEPHQRWMATPAATRPGFLVEQLGWVMGGDPGRVQTTATFTQ
ncbi:MAG TPA: SCO family protein [Candidatus Eisenbacteria bacterium]|jgi:protein SCO1/2